MGRVAAGVQRRRWVNLGVSLIRWSEIHRAAGRHGDNDRASGTDHHHHLHRRHRAPALDALVALGAEVKVSYDRPHPPARQGLALPPRLRLLDGLHRLVEPFGDGAARRARVERAASKVDKRRPPGQVRGDLRQLLGGPRVRGVRPERGPRALRHGVVGPSAKETRRLTRRRRRRAAAAPAARSSTSWPPSASPRPQPQPGVAATGTGKTVVAALDYRRLARGAGREARLLLFVAHRDEILRQSQHHASGTCCATALRRAVRGRATARRVAARLRLGPVAGQVDLRPVDPEPLRHGHRRRVPPRRRRPTAGCSSTSSPRCCSASPPRPSARTARRILH